MDDATATFRRVGQKQFRKRAAALPEEGEHSDQEIKPVVEQVKSAQSERQPKEVPPSLKKAKLKQELKKKILEEAEEAVRGHPVPAALLLFWFLAFNFSPWHQDAINSEVLAQRKRLAEFDVQRWYNSVQEYTFKTAFEELTMKEVRKKIPLVLRKRISQPYCCCRLSRSSACMRARRRWSRSL
jgi:hypothetical protein